MSARVTKLAVLDANDRDGSRTKAIDEAKEEAFQKYAQTSKFSLFLLFSFSIQCNNN